MWLILILVRMIQVLCKFFINVLLVNHFRITYVLDFLSRGLSCDENGLVELNL